MNGKPEFNKSDEEMSEVTEIDVGAADKSID